jgi:hypothetical protein
VLGAPSRQNDREYRYGESYDDEDDDDDRVHRQ